MIKLHELRKEKKLSQNEIAFFLNVTPQAYSRYERGERELGYENLDKLAKFFDVSIDYLLGVSDYYYPDKLQHSSLPEYTAEERNLIKAYRELRPDLQSLLLDTVALWQKQNAPSEASKKKA